ncbi:MAG: flippase-like domain-containing protein [Cellulomonas sp.]|uniref:lysylphosphatidylglycerol synthase domain-containing protein n=1 Tax=Cellulomonas sp. TaxID=40001 RepID=UPI0019EEF32D|nr:lysylphosphatidylglycerol synthase domain-containing protein [Cellulomonas sp.]MBF0686350.1 flippase-like domain-containing protein [Cellulomonas sp.]MBF0687208.1 flippase-like domain-containing protein [Cellulomonas sp.]
MGRLLALLRNPAVRTGFVVVAVGAAVVAVVVERETLLEALDSLSAGAVLLAAALGAVFLVCTGASWRTVLADLGSPLPRTDALVIFGVSQLGKYVPGGVWNVVAAGEMGAVHRIPRRRSVTAMGVSVLVSVVTGLALGVLTVATVGARGLDLRWLWWAAPVMVLLLVPPVLNRCLALGMRVLRQPVPEEPLTTSGTLRAVAWAIVGWLAIGCQVGVIATALGLPLTVGSFLLCVGAYALAWVVGFLVVVTPAGLGAREVVLAAMLGGSLASGQVLLVVLSSRVLQTVGDLALAGLGALLARRAASRRRAAAGTGVPSHGEAL